MADIILSVGFTVEGGESQRDALIRVVNAAELTEEALQNLNDTGTLGDAAEDAERARRAFIVLADSPEDARAAWDEHADAVGDVTDDIIILRDETRGLVDDLRTVGRGFQHVASGIATSFVDTTKNVVGGVYDVADAFTAMGSVAGEAFDIAGSAALDFVGAISDLGQMLDGVAVGGMFQLDQQAARLTGQMDGATMSSDEFEKSVLDVATAAGVSHDAVGDLAYQLTAAGQIFTELPKTSQDAMAKMVGALGMPVDEVQKFSKHAELMGTSITELADDAAYFSKTFNAPDVIQQMPGITRMAIKAQAQFGKSVVTASRGTTFAVSKMAIVYQKALGKTMVEAAQDAQDHFMAFAAETRSFKDVFLGLADDFSPLQTAFLEAGVGIDEMGSLMEDAATDPAGFVDQVERIRNSLDPHMAERFFQQVLRNAPESAKMLLTNQEALRNATAEQREQMEKEAKAREEAQKQQAKFNSMLGEMRNNVVDAHDIFKSLLGTLQTKAGLTFAEDLTKGFEILAEVIGKALGNLTWFIKSPSWETLGDILVDYGLSDFVEWAEKLGISLKGVKEQFDPLLKKLGLGEDTFGKLAAVAIGTATAIGAISAVIGPLAVALAPFGKLIFGIGKTFLSLTKGVLGTKGAASGLGAIFKRIALPLGILLSLWEGFKDRFDDIGKAIKDGRLGDAFDEVIGGLGDSVNAFFLGLPKLFMEGFRNVGQKVDTEGSETFGKTVGKVLGKVLVTISDWTKGTLWPWLKEQFGEGKIVDEFLLPAFSGLAAVGEHILAFFKGVLVGIGEQFGYSEKEVNLFLDIVGSQFEIAWKTIYAFFANTVGKMQDIWEGLKYLIEDFTLWAVDTWQQTMAKIDVASISVFGGIGVMVSGVWNGIVSTMAGAFETITEHLRGLFMKLRPLFSKVFGEDATNEMQSFILNAESGFARVGNQADATAARRKKQHEDELRAAKDSLVQLQKTADREATERLKKYGERKKERTDAASAREQELRDLKKQQKARVTELGASLVGAEVPGATNPEEAGRRRQDADDRVRGMIEMRAAATQLGGVGAVGTDLSMQDLASLVSSLQAARAESGVVAPGSMTAAQLQQYKQQLTLKLAPTSPAADYFRRALDEMFNTATTKIGSEAE